MPKSSKTDKIGKTVHLAPSESEYIDDLKVLIGGSVSDVVVYALKNLRETNPELAKQVKQLRRLKAKKLTKE